jgi:hypothetical protein
MASPFSMFRKHEKVLMVALTVLAMVAFIFLDQVTPDQVPALFGLIAGALLFWALGAQTGRGWIYAIAGGVLGLIVGLTLPRLYGPAPAVSSIAGDLGERELYDMIVRRQRANEFVYQAQLRSLDEEQMFRQPDRAYFGMPGEEEVVRTWLLNKEADELGIHLSDDAVIDFIKSPEITGGRLRPDDFIAIRNSVGLSESQLLELLKYELRADTALRMLLPNLYPTPEQYWDLYRRMNVTTELAVAEVPVDAFVNAKAEPSESDLRRLFEEFRDVAPNQRGPGEPGFLQPQRVQFAYVEADFAQAREKIQPPTEEEVREYYEQNKEQYRLFPRETGSVSPGDTEFFSGNADAPIEAPKPQKSAPALPSLDVPADNAPEQDAPEQNGAAVDPRRIPTFPVSAEDSPPPPEQTAEEPASATEPPAAEPSQPSAESAQQPALQVPAAGETTDPAQPAAPATDPLPEYRPFEDVRDQIREQLYDQRVREALAERIAEAQGFMYKLGQRHQAPPESGEEKMSAKEVSEALKQYAEEHGLRYVASGLVSREELSDPDKYPIALATDPVQDPTGRQNAQTLEQHLFGTGPDVLYNPFIVETPLDQNRYAAWKIDDRPGRVPEFEEVRDQVLQAWRIRQARPEAEERARDLAKSVSADQSLADALEGKTIAGAESGPPLRVQQTESFSWLRRLSAPQDNPFAPPVIEMSTISAVENAGEDFMRVVFEELEVGQTGVAPNADRSAYYVVQVKARTPADEEGLARLRESFMREDLFGRAMFGMTMPTAYDMVLGSRQQTMYQEWLQNLYAKYEVQRTQRQDEVALVD